ncbi:bifunctional lysine ketoglutarate reductase /saccharopine dehydrogenase family protein [Planctomycetota bacterium]|nr:bifunctional lysine ketoglutarate reductase /saccharopine dehydrogenase family protein [Planctomycetota bacterium]
MAKIGVRRETKSPWERRVAVTPQLAAQLVGAGHDVIVERSDLRVFPAADYEGVGCTLVDTLPACDVVFGVKEIPEDLLQKNTAYLFFAHVIKGQPYNMPMLRRLLDQGATLLDYERIADENGRRLVFFGRFAGLAGMVDTLWALGHRLDHEGVASPFSAMQPTHAYAGLSEAKAAVRAVGERIKAEGVPAAVHPLIVGVSGNGNVAKGVQEILDCLPCEDIAPSDVARIAGDKSVSDRVVYRVTFTEESLVRPREDGAAFQLQEYYDHPERYEGDFAQYHPHLSLLLNCIYWAEAYPRLVKKTDLPNLVRCKVIGDISCDVEGSIECTVKATEPGEPIYTYDAATDSARMGVVGEGPVICAVDILPAELPRDASESFAATLGQFAEAVAGADYTGELDASGLPGPMARSCVAWRGELTPDYAYIQEHLDKVLCVLCGHGVDSLHHKVELQVLATIQRVHPQWVAADGGCKKCIDHYAGLAGDQSIV